MTEPSRAPSMETAMTMPCKARMAAPFVFAILLAALPPAAATHAAAGDCSAACYINAVTGFCLPQQPAGKSPRGCQAVSH